MGNLDRVETMTTELPELGPDERRLILNCARLGLDDLLLEETREVLAKPLAWDAVLFYAKYHSVASLLYRNLKLFNNLDRIPRDAQRTLLLLSHRTEYQNRLLSKVLHDLLRDFTEAEIPVMVLKGIALVELIYGHFSLRPLIDLNLMIPRQRLNAAKRLLLQNGYAIHPTDPTQGTLFSQIHLEKRKDLEIHILLQWHIVNWPRIHAVDLTRIWAEASSVQLSGWDTLILSPADLVLYLCFQPDKHGFLNFAAIHIEDPAHFMLTEWTNNRLIRFVDIYEVIQHYQNAIDWNLLIERARESGIQKSVYASLHWVTRIMGQVVGPRILEALRQPFPHGIRRWFFEALNQQPNNNTSASRTKTFFRDWWWRKQKLSQLHIIQLMNLLEYMFPSYEELSLLYGLRSKKIGIAVYPFHIVKTFFLGLLPWIYYVLIKGKLLRYVFSREVQLRR
jgi:hypothetical protein